MIEIGIVGLPNVGKSTLFNVLTQLNIPAHNYPFCTIDKNEAVVEFKDKLLEDLGKSLQSDKLMYPLFKFIDIAGLVRGASKGEGLGNMFLSHIREVDIVLYMLRFFEDANITHVAGKIDPLEDLRTVFSELLLKDIESVTNKLEQLEKSVHRYKREQLDVMNKILNSLLEYLNKEKSVFLFLYDYMNKAEKIDSVWSIIDRETALSKHPELEIIYDMFLLTAKPSMIVLNISFWNLEDSDFKARLEETKNSILNYVKEHISPWAHIALTDAKSLYEISKLSKEEKEEFKLNLPGEWNEQSILWALLDYLKLQRIFVGGKKDSREFLVKPGTTARESAGLIHSDLAEHFIRAKIANVEEVILKGADKAEYKTVGEDYVMKDKDYFIILASN